MSIESIYREVFITKALSELSREKQVAFIQALRFVVVEGPFCESLLQAWDEWAQSNVESSENSRPGRIIY